MSKAAPVLQDFILRAQTLSLYRQALRICYRVRRNHPDADLVPWVQHEFRTPMSNVFKKDENSTEVYDRAKAGYWLTRGHQRLRDFQRTLELSGLSQKVPKGRRN